MPDGPRFRTSCRAASRLVLSASIAIALAGCLPEPRQSDHLCVNTATGEPVFAHRIHTLGTVFRIVDHDGFKRDLKQLEWKCSETPVRWHK